MKNKISSSIKKRKILFLFGIFSVILIMGFIFSLTDQEKLTRAYHLASEIDFSGGLGINLAVANKLYVNTLCLNNTCENYSGVLYPASLPDTCPAGKNAVYEYFNGPKIPLGFNAAYPITSEYYDSEDSLISYLLSNNADIVTDSDTCGDKNPETAYVPSFNCDVEETSSSTCYDIQHVVNTPPQTEPVNPHPGTGDYLIDVSVPGSSDEGGSVSPGNVAYVDDASGIATKDNNAQVMAEAEKEDLRQLREYTQYSRVRDYYQSEAYGNPEYMAHGFSFSDFETVMANRGVKGYDSEEKAKKSSDLNKLSGPATSSSDLSGSYTLANLRNVQNTFNVVKTSTDGVVLKDIINSLHPDSSYDSTSFSQGVSMLTDFHTQSPSEIHTNAPGTTNGNVFLVDNHDPNVVYGYSQTSYYDGADDFTEVYNSFTQSDEYSIISNQVLASLGNVYDTRGNLLTTSQKNELADEMIKQSLFQSYFDTAVLNSAVALASDQYYGGADVKVLPGGEEIITNTDLPGPVNPYDYYTKHLVTATCLKRARIKCV